MPLAVPSLALSSLTSHFLDLSAILCAYTNESQKEFPSALTYVHQ